MQKQVLSILFLVGLIGVLTYLIVAGTKNQNSSLNKETNQNKTVSDKTKEEKVQTKNYSNPPAMQIDSAKTYSAKMETSKGVITMELFTKETPVAVNNFVFLAKEGFYDGTTFHRIIKDFMIQGGDPKGDGTGGPGYKFADEKITREYTRGMVAMANSGPNTNGSQFFIMHKDYQLQKNYVIFGKVTEGLDVVDKIAETPVVAGADGNLSKPAETVSINKVIIEEK